ncbi:MAG: NADP oxidoreductase [Planctomycetes bacterium]|nr:NADP oxidoreductase [Planctomycetota bacterium]
MSQDAASASSSGRPLRVAIVGSGPSGFYAAEALFKHESTVHVHMFERFPTPFGLVRFGVAPDHGKIRNVIHTYEKTAAHEHFQFWGNVTIGRDLSIAELQQHFDAVVLAYGAETDRSLDIPGENLARSYTATAFCAWYNGHPDYRDVHFDLSHETVAVIGQGNVAMDVARVLGKSADQLRDTDMADHAIEALSRSKVREIYVIGRRGPAQAAFTPKEIHELGDIPGCDIIVDPEDLKLNAASQQELTLPDHHAAERNMATLEEFARRDVKGQPRRIILRFFQSPVEIRGNAGGVTSIVLEANELSGEAGAQKARGTGRMQELACGVVFRSVGYRGVAMPGAPFDERRAVVPNEHGRVEVGLYVVGWIKRGPSGLIGTNKKDSEDTIERLLEDAPKLSRATADEASLRALLEQRGVRIVTFPEWQTIDAAEIERGASQGKPREKFTRVQEMIHLLDGL